MQSKTPEIRQFITKFDENFSRYFLEAVAADKMHSLSQASPWYFYFSHPELKSWQLKLIGINTHINGDMWQAFVNNFSKAEIEKNKKQFLKVQNSIMRAYNPLFEEMIRDNGYLRFMNSFTKGFVKFSSEKWVYKWRKRSIKLAILYYDDPEKFKRKLIRVKKKKDKIDRLILNKQKFFL